VLPSNTTLVNLMLGGPVPEHVLSFIGAVLSSNAHAATSAAQPSPGRTSPGPNKAAAKIGSSAAAAPQPLSGPGASPSRRRQLSPGPISPRQNAISPPRRPFTVPASSGGVPGASSGGGGSSGDKRADGLARSLTVQARSLGALDPAGIAGLCGGGGADKAAEVFRRHDVDCSGYLDEQEMMSALQDLGILEGLTARQLGEWVGGWAAS